MKDWIDFKHLREQIDFALVLRHYSVSLKLNNSGQHHGKCPLPTHGESESLSFSANMRKKIWRCFGCGASGNCLDFATRMEGGNPDHPADVRKAAKTLIERFNLSPTAVRPVSAPRRQPPSEKSLPPTPAKVSEPQKDIWDAAEQPVSGNEAKERVTGVQQTLVNAPMDFELKNLDPDHVYLRKRGFEANTSRHFGLGYCSKGMFAGRIAIPLHDMEGKLIGYAGRLTDEFEVSADSPTYLWPSEREREGKRLVFDATLLLYNGHRVKVMAPLMDLVITRDFHSVWHLHQAGVTHVVGTTADSISKHQVKLVLELVRPTGRVWFLTNENREGKKYAQVLFGSLGQHRFCRWVRLASGRPDSQGSDGLREAFRLN